MNDTERSDVRPETRPEIPANMTGAVPPKPATKDAPVASTDEALRARIATLEAEAKACEQPAQAALLFHELGLLWEQLKNPRNAAVAYQSAFKAAPKFRANLRAARRLFSQVGNWSMVIQLLEAERASLEDPAAHAPLLFEKGQILEQRLSKEAEAHVAYKEALDKNPTDLSLQLQLEQAFNAKGDFESLVKTQIALAQSVTQPKMKAYYLTAAGLLLEERLNKPDEAAPLFRQAFAHNREDPLLIAAMKRVARREGRIDDLLQALSAEAHTQGDVAGATFVQISKTYERLGRVDEALQALNSARSASPSDPLILSELARVFENQERHEELASTLLAWVQVINDENDFIAVNLRLASLYEEQLKNDDLAAGRYQAILGKVPGHAGALAGLGKLNHRRKDWEGLLSTFDAEVAATHDPRAKAARLYKSAEVLEEHLKQIDRAIERYNECLKLSPGFLPAQKALTRLYEQHQRWTELISMYEQDLLQTTDVEQQIGTLARVASIFEDRLQDLPHAIETLRRILDITPQHLSTLRNLGRLLERQGDWSAIIELNNREGALSSDLKQVVSLLHRNAEIYEDLLKDRTGAIAAYEKILSLNPTYLPALRSLGRLYAQEGLWESLLRMYRTESEISSPDVSATMIFKIGELYEHKIKDEAKAIAAYREVLTLAPAYFPATRNLARLFRGQRAWEQLIEVLQAEAANRTDPTERANAMFQAAAIWEDQLQDPEQAMRAYREVLKLNPGHTSSLQQLERLLTVHDDVKELIAVLDRQTQVGPEVTRISAWLKLAHLYLDRLNEPSRAATCTEAALALDGRHLTALKLLERIRIHEKSRRVELQSRVAASVEDEKLATAIQLLTSDPGAESPTSEDALARLKLAWTQNPNDEILYAAVERALQKAGDIPDLIHLLSKKKERIDDPLERTELLLRIAELHERNDDVKQAASFYEEALTTSPQCYPALESLLRCYRATGNVERTRITLTKLVEVSRNSDTQLRMLLEAGHAARDDNDATAAVYFFQRALSLAPQNTVAEKAYEETLAQRGSPDDLANLHVVRAETKIKQQEPAGAANELLSAAKIHLDALRNRDKAMELLDRALLLHPTLAEGLELKGDLALESGNWADAAAAYSVRVQQGANSPRVASVHLKLGTLYQDRLSDSVRAQMHFEYTLQGDPENPEALERLSQIHSQAAEWSVAADYISRILETELTPSIRARHTLKLAQIQHQGLNDLARAAESYQKAFELLPSDMSTLETLVDLYGQLNKHDDLVRVLEQQAQHSADPKRAVALKLRVATLYSESLKSAHRAIVTYRSILDLEPQNTTAQVALANLLTQDPTAMGMAVDAHRALLKQDPLRVESWRALYSLWHQHRQLDRAFCAAGVLSFLRRATEPELHVYHDTLKRLPSEPQTSTTLGPGEIDQLRAPNARSPVVAVFRSIGDQLAKVFPVDTERLGIDKKADRLKNDNPLVQTLASVARVFGVSEFEVYQIKRGSILLETGDPLWVCIGQDFARKYSTREQKFLFGRAALGIFDKTAVLRKASSGEAADLVGNSVRIHFPEWSGLGRKSEEQSKQLRKAYSRKALKSLEESARAVVPLTDVNLDTINVALIQSQNHAGLLLSGDVNASLLALLKEDANAGSKADTAEGVAQLVAGREDLKDLMLFAVSDDFFRLRQRLGLST